MSDIDVRSRPGEPAWSGSDQRTPRLVGAAWALLFVNTLGFGGSANAVLPISRSLFQAVTMGSLVVAFCLALLLNPRVRIRPVPYLLLLSLLLTVSIASSITWQSGGGALLRCARLAVFIATLWLLSRWWRGDLTFVRYTVRVLGAFLLTVVLGIIIAPGNALGGADENGRLVGVLWPMHAPQVGQYGAIVAGLVILLWLVGYIGRTNAILIVSGSVALLLLSHTRTATITLLVAVAGACLSLWSRDRRIRRAMAVGGLCAGLATVLFSTALMEWFQRGQDSDQFENLTGRQVVWDALLGEERGPFMTVFGTGLSDKSYDGASIDNSWLAVYDEQGILGLVIVTAVLLSLLAAAMLRPATPERACAIFLILYCVVSSYTEVGLGDASAFLLYLAVAASLLIPRAPVAARTWESR